MRILFDQGTPVPLRNELPAHVISTALEMGWETLKNGELLQAAETQFDVFVTTDQSLKYQQNLAGRKLAIFVLPFASWPRLKCHVAEIATAIDSMKAGDYVEFQVK